MKKSHENKVIGFKGFDKDIKCRGTQYKVGEGMTGRCYAFPTLDRKLNQRSNVYLEQSAERLFECCLRNPQLEFLLTKIGCGIAGYDEEYIRSLFECPPKNLILPAGWGINIKQ